MRIDEKIISEIETYRRINKYITEQEAPPPPADPAAAALPPPPADPAAAGAAPPPVDAAAGAPPAPPAGTPPEPVDTATDPEVEKLGDEKDKTKEVEVTDLVQSQKNVEKKQEEYFDTLFKHLEDLESKLSNMDTIVTKLNDLEAKVEKYRTKTPEEKLELRSLDSGPFNQKLSQFFDDKMTDMEKTGKNEYILTTDEVEDYSPSEVKKSFRNFEGEDDSQEDNFLKIT